MNNNIHTNNIDPVEYIYSRIIKLVVSYLEGVEAIILMGSFSRNEGNITSSNGNIKVLNDFDILIYKNKREDNDLDINYVLSKEFDFTIDISILYSKIKSNNPSQYLFDLRFGSKIIFGNPLILENLNDISPDKITKDHGFVQFLNRISGIISLRFKNNKDADYYNYQFIKLTISIFDLYLIHINDYASSYEIRKYRILNLLHIFNFPQNVIKIIKNIYDIKLNLLNMNALNASDINIIIKNIIPTVYFKIYNKNFNIINIFNNIDNIPISSYLNSSHKRSKQQNIYKANFNVFHIMFYKNSNFISTNKILKLLKLNSNTIYDSKEILSQCSNNWFKITH